ncbi:TonB-dependent receptor [Mangrovicella endophytica]|uniref:TonB-dependent receptor n=1 Tax=Mangrovicella endophytica TaxID=2066697 RepID=UPI000C9DE8DD|nr:TonB-dependent receptor [Mangrovicella endophytica]
MRQTSSRPAQGRIPGRSIKAVWLGSAALGLALAALPILVGTAAAQTVAGTGGLSLDIPSQDLGRALTVFADRAGLRLLVPSDLVAGRRSPALAGTYTRGQALDRLLAGSNLSYGISGSTITISGPSASEAAALASAGDGTIVLDVVNVLGDRTAAADAPYSRPDSSAHIDAEQLARVPATSVGDVFKSTPGVISAGNRVGASLDVNIRGLQGQNRVAVLVDGTQQSGGTYRGYRGARSEVYVDPDFLGGIDITKGPSGGAGGVGAMGGVVNLRTIDAADVVKPGQTFGALVKGSLGSNTDSPPDAGTLEMRDDRPGFINGEAWSGSAAVAVTEENYDLVAGVSRRKAGNYYAGKKGSATFYDDRAPFSTPFDRPLSPFGPGEEVFNTSQDVTSFLTKGTVRWGDGQSLKLGYTFYDNEYGENYETLLNFALPSVPGGFTLPAEQYDLSHTRTHTFTSEYKFDPSDSDLIDLTAHLWASELSSRSGPVELLLAQPGLLGDTDVRSYGGDVSNTSFVDTAVGSLTVTNGAEFVLERARGDATVIVYDWGDVQPLSFNPNGDRDLVSVFNQSKLDITSWLTLGGGLRYDHYSSHGTGETADFAADKSGSRVNPQVNVTVTPFDGVQLFGSYVEGWRPPSLRETTAMGFGGLVVNPDLDPETSKNFEFGINVSRDDLITAGDTARFKAVRFDNNYDDYIIRYRRPDFVYSWTNIDEASFRGYELSASYDAGYAFVEAAYTRYDDVKFCNDEVCGPEVAATDYGIMTIPPKYTATLTGGVRLFERKLTLGGRAYMIGERFGGYDLAPGAVNPPTYWAKETIFDVFGSYKFTDDVSLDASVENIGDRYYLDPLASGLVPAPGRTFRANMSLKF